MILADSNWSTVASLSTAAGTLVLAAATFSSVRSSNRSARTAEQAYAARMRPVLAPSRLDDPMQKVGWMDRHWVRLEGSRASVEVVDDTMYLAASLRNVGSGIAVLRSWCAAPTPDDPRTANEHADVDGFRRLTRDIYIAAGDIGFWQGAIRDRSDPSFDDLERCVKDRKPIMVEVLYGDLEGGQRAISRLGLTPLETNDSWLCAISRHWHLDRPDPR